MNLRKEAPPKLPVTGCPNVPATGNRILFGQRPLRATFDRDYESIVYLDDRSSWVMMRIARRLAIAAILVCAAGSPPSLFAACGTPGRLTPANTALLASNAGGVCGFASSGCSFGQSITLSVETFGADLSCTPHTFNWDFGDGIQATTTTRTVVHVYSQPGVYTPRVTITGADTMQLDGSATPTLLPWVLSALGAALASIGVLAIRR